VHTESRVARHFEINVFRRDPVTSNVRHPKTFSICHNETQLGSL